MGWTRSQQLGTSQSERGRNRTRPGEVGNTSSKTTPKTTEVTHDAQAREPTERIATTHRGPETQTHADDTHTHKPDHDYRHSVPICGNLSDNLSDNLSSCIQFIPKYCSGGRSETLSDARSGSKGMSRRSKAVPAQAETNLSDLCFLKLRRGRKCRKHYILSQSEVPSLH